jgi:hypothetical protein
MHSWLNTYHTVASSLVVKLLSGLATVVVTIILLAPSALSQSDSVRLEMSAVDLARKVVSNELKVQNEEQSHWMYRLEKAESGIKQIKKILETKNGSLSQLLSIDGHPLDAKQLLKENQRIQRLVSHPDEQRKLQQASNKKAEQGARLFRILPDVFVFSYAGRQGNLVTLNFTPNPSFQSPSLEVRVFHGMEGEMTVDYQAREVGNARRPSYGGCQIRIWSTRTPGQGKHIWDWADGSYTGTLGDDCPACEHER